MSYDQRIFEELLRVRRLLEFLVRDNVGRELEKTVKTRERRRIWGLMDGLRSTEELARETGVSQRAVQLFVKDLLRVDLVTMDRRGYPKRNFDYVPATWRVE